MHLLAADLMKTIFFQQKEQKEYLSLDGVDALWYIHTFGSHVTSFLYQNVIFFSAEDRNRLENVFNQN